LAGYQSTFDLAGPKPAANSTHSVALTNNFDTTAPQWIHISRNITTLQPRDPLADTNHIKRQLWPTSVIAYNANQANSGCYSTQRITYTPENFKCTCGLPFNGASSFTEVRVSSQVAGFIVNLYKYQPLAGGCDNYFEQLFQY
jgi:hypothetical protein